MRSQMPYTLGEFLAELTRLLSPIADDFAESEANTIAEHLLQFSYSDLRRNRSMNIERTILEKAQAILTERLTGKPLAYVLGKTFFYSKEFILSSETLIPRPDTEHLIEAILKNEPTDPRLILELGTGSGIIPEILTSERESWHLISVDLCEDTIKTAKLNCCSDRIQLIVSDCFNGIVAENQIDCIISNPPYIPQDVVENELDSSVREYEPHRALAGGVDGLDFYRYLAETAKNFLVPGGRIYLEIGYDQGESVPAILSTHGAEQISVIRDYGNRDRVVTAVFP